MSKSSGFKRKATDLADSNVSNLDKDESNGNVGELEKELAMIKDGRHPLLLEKLESLQRAKENKLAEAERHRMMMIKNINQLHEYEVADAQALYNKAYADIQERLIEELTANHQHRIENQRSAEEALVAASMMTMHNDHSKNGNSSTQSAGVGRSLRSTSQLPTDKPNGDTIELAGMSSKSTQNSSRARRKPTANSIGIDCALPESAMRSDFVEIVRDLHSRAAAYAQSKPKSTDINVRLTGDLTELIISNDSNSSTSYSAGDLVVVFSVYSQENISGIITALSHKEIVIRTNNGVRFSVLVGQIRSGRVTISKNKDVIDNSHIFNAAAEIDELLNRYHR